MNSRLLGLLTASVLCLAPAARAQTTWVVDDDLTDCAAADFTTIQEAIDAAAPGDVIRVCTGEYYAPPGDPEPPIHITKTLALLGPNEGVDGCSDTRTDEALIEAHIRLAADDVTIDGFSLTGAYWSVINQEAGPSTDRARILNNVFDGMNRFGVINRPVAESSGWIIARNRFSNWVNPDAAAVRLRNAPQTQVRENCIITPRLPNTRAIELSATPESIVADNVITRADGEPEAPIADGIVLYDWDGPTFGLDIERNEVLGLWNGIRTEGGAAPMGGIRIMDNRVIDPMWDGITIWSGQYGRLFIERNEIRNGGMEAIHVEGHPEFNYPEVNVNANRIENVNLAAINFARGDFGFVHIGDNEITGAAAGIRMEGGGIGVDQLHVNHNTIQDVHGPAIGLQPIRYNFVHVGWNTLNQDIGMLPWDVGLIDIRTDEFPVGPIMVMENTLELRGGGPAAFGVNLVGRVHEFTMGGNDLVSLVPDGVPGATGFVAGAPGAPPFPEDARIRLECNEFTGFEWGVRTIAPDGSPGGFPGPPADFSMEQNGFIDVAWPVDNGASSAPIHAPWNYWGSDGGPVPMANVEWEPFLTLLEYDSDQDGIRNCHDPEVDGDGVPNEHDLCMGTAPDQLLGELGPNQWRLNEDLVFETVRKGRGEGGHAYTLFDMWGCSCFQAVGELDARGYFWSIGPDTGEPLYDGFDGHLKKGCSPSVMDAWIYVAEHGELPPTDEPPAGKGPESTPESFALHAAYPNPFNPVTTLVFDLPETARVRVAVYDVLGRQVRVLTDGTLSAGTHRVTFDAAGLPSGVYLVRFEHPEGARTRTVQLLK